MKKTTLGFCLALVAGSCLLTGCATEKVSVLQGGDSGKIIDKVLDTEDFRVKGEEMVNSLLESSVLDKAAQHPAIIAIGRIVNNTTLYIDTDLLMKKIRFSINKNGKAITDTTGGVLNTVDFTFSGKIIDTYVTSGNKKQHTYTFQLSLTDSRGLAVWEEEKEVTKLTTRHGLGG
jgi:PBP1b-binding outer membrane lipoprotein LpoB